MAYAYGGTLTEESVREYEAKIHAKMLALKRLEEKIDARFAALLQEQPIRQYLRGKGAEGRCGTYSGVTGHQATGTPTCEACKSARALYQREYRRRKKQAKV